jgi:hypothetical protein
VLSASVIAKEIIETKNLVLSAMLSIRCRLLLRVASLRAFVIKISHSRAFKSSFASELPLALTYTRRE